MLRKGSEKVRAPWHYEVCEVESGRDRTAAQRKAVTERYRRLQRACRHDDLRPRSLRYNTSEHGHRVRAVVVDHVKRHRIADIVMPQFVRSKDPMKCRKHPGWQQEVDRRRRVAD